tara:strand:- start:1015 stop:2181 length:1167 start_codon:yes stop_codon:yes gene_type:complete
MPKSKGTIDYSILLMIIYTIITCILIGSAYHYWKQITTSKKVEPFKWKKVKKAVKKVEKTFFGSSSSSSSVVKAVVAAAPVAPVITYPNMNPPYVQSSGNILPTTVKVSTATSDTTLPISTSALSSYDDKTINFELNVNIHGKQPQTNGYNYNYKGCYIDDGNRALPLQVTINKLTPSLCAQECGSRNYDYFGVQDGFACFCGGSDYAKLGQSSDGTYDGCYMPCTGDDKQVCGGYWRNSVYSISPYQGSYQDAGTTKLKNLYLYDKDGKTIVTKTFSDSNVGPSNNYINKETFIITYDDIGSNTITSAGISVGNDNLMIDSAVITCYPLDISNNSSYCYPNASYSEIKINDKTIDANGTLEDLTFSEPITLNQACLSDIPGRKSTIN